MSAGGTVALLDWSHLLEDYLDNLGLSFESFRDEMTGGWMFGYIAALGRAGCRAVLYCVSARVGEPLWCTHRPTGARICVLPATGAYRAVRRRVPNPYADTLDGAAGELRGVRRGVTAVLKHIAPYVATPLAALARELERAGCDAILCQEYEHARFDACVLLGRLLERPVFATFQGGDRQLSRLERPLRPLSVRSCAGLIVATKSEAERVRSRYGLPGERLARIFNPIDLAAWPEEDRAEARASIGLPAGMPGGPSVPPLPPAARVVAWHGRVDLKRKGLDVLLDAWDRVVCERPGRELRLLLIGAGRDGAELRQRVRLARGIVWDGEYLTDRAALRRHLAAADVYVFPSRHEGFPVAPIEAMACGLPVVAADAPGVPDIFEGGEASGGLVVRRGDAAALAQALGRLIDDAPLALELGRRARRRVRERFSLEAVGGQLRSFLFEERR